MANIITSSLREIFCAGFTTVTWVCYVGVARIQLQGGWIWRPVFLTLTVRWEHKHSIFKMLLFITFEEEGRSLNRNLGVLLHLRRAWICALGRAGWIFRIRGEAVQEAKGYLQTRCFSWEEGFLHCKLSPPSLEGRRKGVLNSILASKYTNKEKQRIKDGWMGGWMVG